MKRQGWMQGHVRMLALRDPLRELLLALIEAVHEVDDRYDNHEERIRALEAKARDYQEDGELAMRLRVETGPRPPHPFDTCRCGHMRMGHQEDGTCNATCGCDLFCLPYHHPDGTPDIFAGAAACDLVERAETAERERDEAREAREVWKHATREFKAERDAARAALAKYGRHERECTAITLGTRLSPAPCDCGLTAALNASPA